GVMVFAPGAFGPWGLRSGLMGLLIGAVAVVLASANLIMDFDQIERGVRNGVDRKYAWSAAFGLTVTLIWLYLEFLRLLAILNRSWQSVTAAVRGRAVRSASRGAGHAEMRAGPASCMSHEAWPSRHRPA